MTMYDGFYNLLRMNSGRKCFLNVLKANIDSIVFHSVIVLKFNAIFVIFLIGENVLNVQIVICKH